MPVQKTKKTSTGVQQSLKSTWTNSTKKAAAPGEKKTTSRNSSAVVSAVPTAPTTPTTPKRTVKKKRSVTDESSAEESDIESFSSVESERDEVRSVQSVEEVEEIIAPIVKKKKSEKQLIKAIEESDSTIHTKDETKAQKMLRKFDLSYEYGPCAGVNRLERWNRADALGLEPPVEVRDVLLSKEGEGENAKNVFDGRV